MKISLPQQAHDHFNKEADMLLSKLGLLVKKDEPKKPPLSTSHQPVEHIFAEKELLSFGSIGEVDGFGNQLTKYFHTDKGFVGLNDSDFETFQRLADQIAQRAEVRKYLTRRYVGEVMFKWLEERYKGSIPESQRIVEYLSLKAESEIKQYKIGIPLSFVVIQEPFAVGRVTFDFCTREFFDEFELATKKKNPDLNAEAFNKLRKKYQGVVFSNISVCAERERCIEMAVEETERALMILRFFSPSTFIPQIPSYFGRMGYTDVPIGHYFIYSDSFPNIMERNEENVDANFTIDSKHLRSLKNTGLEEMNNLLTKDDLNEFEKLFLNSISLFSKGIVSKDNQDKVVFCLASIETLLLKDSSEPIQRNLGLRLAFVVGDSLEERKSIISLVKKAYEIRSSYLHHGERKHDIAILTELQHTIWTALSNIMSNREKFSNQTQLIDYIEDMILS